MSAVETIRDIPVIMEHIKGYCEPMTVDDVDSGFPFDNSRRSRDPLEDIAQRHPEFAQHLQGFPRRTRRSSQDNDEFLRRRFERPFSSGRFERFGFPFDRDDFDREPQRYYEAYPEYFENFQNQHPQSPQQQQSYSPQSPQYSQQYQPPNQNYSQQTSSESQPKQQPPYHSQVSQGTQTETDQTDAGVQEEQKAEGGQTRGRPIQQSNTCDLGQKQPVDEAVNDRSQRSMSAPPENKRFTSSINIPMGGQQGQENGTKPQSQSGSSGSTERVIPIHVEGRDDPVLPKNFSTTSSQPQPERIFTDSPRPQPERIFGQRPENFTQFVHREPHRFQNDWPSHFDRSFPEEEFGFARSGSPSRFGGAKQPPQPTHVPPQYQQRQQDSQQQQTEEQKPSQNEPVPQPKPQPPKQPLGPIEQIQAIQKDVSDLLKQVEVFSGAPKDKNYLYLDEMLTRNLIKLDNIDTQGQDAIRNARREAIKCIERAISLLEAKASANVASQEEKMDVDSSAEVRENAQAEPQQENKMDVEASTSQDAYSKSGESEKHDKSSKSDESLENTEKQTNENQEEVKQEVQTAEVQVNAEEVDPNQEVKPQESSEGQNTSRETHVTERGTGGGSEGEKKEKKKTKKKASKEDKEKKQ